MSGAIGGFAIGQTPIGGYYVQSYTAGDIIKFALKAAGILGVGQSALAEDTADTLAALNGMIGQWNRKRWLIWHLLDLSVTIDGRDKYSIGPGGDYDVPRPDRLEGAYFRQYTGSTPNHVDYWLQILQSMEDYGKIPLKSLTTFPQAVFYDSAVPIGYVHPYPIPNLNGIYELHVLIKDTLNQFATVDTPILLPPEYYEAIWTNLGIRLGAFYPGAVITPQLEGLAKASLATIRGANAQVPRLLMPQGMSRPPLFNIYSGTTY